MTLKLTNLRLPVDVADEDLPSLVARRLRARPEELHRWRILRKSLDARSRTDLTWVFTLAVDLDDEAARIARLSADSDVRRFEPEAFDDPPPGSRPLEHRPVVVGSGPAGLLAAYWLARKGYRPLVIERGKAVKERVPAIRAFDRGGSFDPQNNYLFGEGGAGAFSDGKLTCRITGADVDWVLERFVECGGRPSLVYEHRPHLGSNKLPMICRNFRRSIEAYGGEYRFDCCLEGIEIVDGQVCGLKTSSGLISARAVILAIGHSARDTYEMLVRLGAPLMPKAFQLGLRIEQPQETVNRKKYADPQHLARLGAADYSLIARGQRDLFTFCMCAGGLVIPSVSEGEKFCTNGMSNSRHDTPYANSGLVVTLEPHEFGSDHPLAGVEIQRKYEAIAFEIGRRNYLCPIQTAADFLAGRTPPSGAKYASSYERGLQPANLHEVLPPQIAQAVAKGLPVMDAKWRGEFLKDAMLVGPEMRGSSPVRIDRDSTTRQCPNIAGLYPVGEGAGYAGGIVTAAVDGLRSARMLTKTYAPLEA